MHCTRVEMPVTFKVSNTQIKDERIHVKIQDSANDVYQVPASVFSRPPAFLRSNSRNADLCFKYVAYPFSFSIIRAKTGEVLFDTSAASIVFEVC